MLSNLAEKIKAYEREIFIVSATVLALLIGVGAVRLFILKEVSGEAVFQEGAFPVSFSGEALGPQQFVASKNGTKFYPIACKAAARINAENRIFFASAIDAQKAGFSASTQCK